MASQTSKPEITTTNIETPTSPQDITASKEIQDALNATAAATMNNNNLKDCPQKIQHRLSLRLNNSPGSPHSPQSMISPRSPKSPNRSISPHLGLVNKLYNEELLADELITTTQVDEDIIEAVNKINSATSNLSNKQLYSPNRSPEPRKTNNSNGLN